MNITPVEMAWSSPSIFLIPKRLVSAFSLHNTKGNQSFASRDWLIDIDTNIFNQQAALGNLPPTGVPLLKHPVKVHYLKREEGATTVYRLDGKVRHQPCNNCRCLAKNLFLVRLVGWLICTFCPYCANDLELQWLKWRKVFYKRCWGRLVASKPALYYSKCPFWPQQFWWYLSDGLVVWILPNITLSYDKNFKVSKLWPTPD